jgi:hypothetical protein
MEDRIMAIMKSLLNYIIILSFLSACATQKAYEGQARDSDELSVISPPPVSLFKMGPTFEVV